MSKLCLDIEDH